MAIQGTKAKARAKVDRIDKQVDDSSEPAKRLPRKLPELQKLDPRATVQPSKQKHPPRAPGP